MGSPPNICFTRSVSPTVIAAAVARSGPGRGMLSWLDAVLVM